MQPQPPPQTTMIVGQPVAPNPYGNPGYQDPNKPYVSPGAGGYGPGAPPPPAPYDPYQNVAAPLPNMYGNTQPTPIT